MARAMDESNLWYSIEKIIECPVCFEVPQGYILQCSTGHHICEFCKNKVPNCPTCHARISETRNFLAEGMANKIEDIKLFITNEIRNIKLDCKRESTSTSTQTMSKSKLSFATQTDEKARPNIENYRAKGAAPCTLPYSCQIGSCMFKSFYRGLLQHLAEYHKDTFYEVREMHGQFTETCTITTNALPHSYDFAFLKNGKDLFFFNFFICGSGYLKARVLLAKAEVANLYHYDLTIKNGAFQLTRHGKVIPRGGSTAMVCSNNVWIRNEELCKNTSLIEVGITIKRCVCKQFRENAAAVNP